MTKKPDRGRRGPGRRPGDAGRATSALRQEVANFLTGEQAHVSVIRAVSGLSPELRGRRPSPGVPSVYEQLEHIRLAQEDILRYTLDPAWTSPPWPDGYWPAAHRPTEAAWRRTLRRFRADLAGVVALVRDPGCELLARIPHGQGRTYLRQVLLVADHNAYHAGQIVHARRRLGAWPA